MDIRRDVGPLPIGLIAYVEADHDAHVDYYSAAIKARNDYLNHRPRIDTREDLYFLVEKLDALHAYYSFEAGRRLRKATISDDDHQLHLDFEDLVLPLELARLAEEWGARE